MITYNGNEMMLQNDMGNTLIQDSTTGHIMGLSEGFVPVGLKEHGGIMYIASVNKEGKGEIGTIPSPILYIEDSSVNVKDFLFSLIESGSYPKELLTILDGYKLYPGDKFLVELSLNTDTTPLLFKGFKYQYVSTADKKGLVDIELFSICNNNPYKLEHATIECQEFIDKDGKLKSSPYWFLNNEPASLDVQKTYTAGLFKTYPGNFPPGQLGIRAVLNTIDYFDFIEIEQDLSPEKFTLTAPKIIKEADTGQLFVQFSGFLFKTNSGRFVGSVELALSEQKSHIEIPLTKLEPDQITWEKQHDGAWHIYLNGSDGVTAPVKYDTWYQVTVKQYDLYNGYIDTFTYSFNPKYLLNGIETSARWSAIEYYPQKAHIFENDDAQIEIYPASVPSTISKTVVGTTNISLDASHVWFYDSLEMFFPAFYSNPKHIDFNSAVMSVPIPDDRISYLYDKIDSINIDIQVDGSLMSVGYSGGSAISVEFPVTSDFKAQINGNQCTVGTGAGSYPCSLLSYRVEGDQWHTLPSDFAVTSLFTDPIIKFSDIISINRGDFDVKLNLLTISNLSISIDLPTSVPLRGLESKLGEGSKEEGFYYLKFEISKESTISELRFPDITYFAKAQTVDNLSPYTISPWFELRGDYNEYADIPIGFNKYGELKPAMHFDTNCIGYLDKDTTLNIITSIALDSDSIGYYPSAGEATIILSKGSYLITMNRKGLTNPLLKITIDNTILSCSPSVKLLTGGYSFVPQLLYLPEDSTVKIEWNNMDKLKNIGVFLVNDLIEVKSGKWETESPRLINYDSEELITELILPVCASYYENVLFSDSITFDYYTGTKYDYQIDYALIYDKDTDTVCKKDFVYKYNNANPLKSQIDSIDGIEDSIIYRFKN